MLKSKQQALLVNYGYNSFHDFYYSEDNIVNRELYDKKLNF